MPVVCDAPTAANVRDLLRHQRIRKYIKARPGFKDVLVELLGRVEDECLLEPAIAYDIHPVDRIAQERCRCEDAKASPYGAFLAGLSMKCHHFAAIVCTVGPRMEEEMSEYFENRRFSRAILLDSIAMAALDSLCRKARQYVTSEALEQSLFVCGLSIQGRAICPSRGQCDVLDLVPAEEIGVTMTSRGLVFPQKSAWMLIGLQRQPTPPLWAKDYVRAGRQEAAVTASVP